MENPRGKTGRVFTVEELYIEVCRSEGKLIEPEIFLKELSSLVQKMDQAGYPITIKLPESNNSSQVPQE